MGMQDISLAQNMDDFQSGGWITSDNIHLFNAEDFEDFQFGVQKG